MRVVVCLFGWLLLAVPNANAQAWAGLLSSSRATDWPQLLGPSRNGVTDEKITSNPDSSNYFGADPIIAIDKVTTGSVDDAWLDFRGHPATDALHLVERYWRRDFGHLEIQFTIDDAKAYRRPWSVTMTFDLLADTELIEHICENERDAAHIVGK